MKDNSKESNSSDIADSHPSVVNVHWFEMSNEERANQSGNVIKVILGNSGVIDKIFLPERNLGRMSIHLEDVFFPKRPRPYYLV